MATALISAFGKHCELSPTACHESGDAGRRAVKVKHKVQSARKGEHYGLMSRLSFRLHHILGIAEVSRIAFHSLRGHRMGRKRLLSFFHNPFFFRIPAPPPPLTPKQTTIHITVSNISRSVIATLEGAS